MRGPYQATASRGGSTREKALKADIIPARIVVDLFPSIAPALPRRLGKRVTGNAGRYQSVPRPDSPESARGGALVALLALIFRLRPLPDKRTPTSPPPPRNQSAGPP